MKMKNVFLLIFVIFLSLRLVSAQTERQKPILVDEFGKLNAEENFVRLENLASELSKNENAKALIRINGGSETCFLCHYRQGSYMTAILKSWIIPNEKKSVEYNKLGKYSIEYCNGNEDLKVQLYLMPPNSKLSDCHNTPDIPKRSVLFHTVHFYFNTQQITPLENSRVETTSPADGDYSLSALKEVKKILDEKPESRIYIVVYLGTNLEEGYFDKKKGFIEKQIRRLDNRLIEKSLIQNSLKEFVKNGIKPSQISTIKGGYVDGKRKLEFWFVPKSGKIPTPKPETFPKKRKRRSDKINLMEQNNVF